MFPPLVVGAKLVIARPGGHKDPDYMAKLLLDRKITGVSFSVPTLAREWAASTKEPNPLIRNWSIGGEAVSKEDIQIMRRAFPQLTGPIDAYGEPTQKPTQGSSLPLFV